MPRPIKTKRAVKSGTSEKSPEQDNADYVEGNSALVADAGYLEIPVETHSIDVYELACRMNDIERPVLQIVMDTDEVKDIASDEIVVDINGKFGTVKADKVRAVTILTALGFSEERQHAMCSDFSAHWRVRIALAKALYMHQSSFIFGDRLNLDDRATLEKELKSEDKVLHENLSEEKSLFANEEPENLTICCICQYSLQTTRLPTCSHVLHLSCARTYFKDNNWRKCPLCKISIPLGQLRTYGIDIARESTTPPNRVSTLFPFDSSDESDAAVSPTDSSRSSLAAESLQFQNLSPPTPLPRTWSPQLSPPRVFSNPELSPLRYPSPQPSPPRWGCSPSRKKSPSPISSLIPLKKVSSFWRRLPLESSSPSPFLPRTVPSCPAGTIPSSRGSDSISTSLPLESSSARTSPFLPRTDPSCPTGTIPSTRRSDSISRSLPLESSLERAYPFLTITDPLCPTGTRRRSGSISRSLPLERTSFFLPRTDRSCPSGTIPLPKGSDPETLVSNRSVPRLSPLCSRRVQWFPESRNLCSRSMPLSWNYSPFRKRQSRQRNPLPPQKNSRSPMSPNRSSLSTEKKQTSPHRTPPVPSNSSEDATTLETASFYGSVDSCPRSGSSNSSVSE